MKETKSAKRVRELLKHVSRLCTGKNRTHLACAEGSALQCCSLIGSWRQSSTAGNEKQRGESLMSSLEGHTLSVCICIYNNIRHSLTKRISFCSSFHGLSTDTKVINQLSDTPPYRTAA